MDRNSKMEIRQVFTMNMIVASCMLFQACIGSSYEPTPKDIIGSWRSSEKAEVIFDSSGTFTANLIPTEFGFIPTDDFKGVKFNGSGKWTLKKGNANWEVYLDFDKVNINKAGCVFPLLIAGENGALDNKPPWYLFVWKEEEGGERYKFLKQ